MNGAFQNASSSYSQGARGLIYTEILDYAKIRVCDVEYISLASFVVLQFFIFGFIS